MTVSLDAIKKIIDQCSEEERKALGKYLRQLSPHPLERSLKVDADTILTAIERSSDLTKRGIRGIIAEAVFVNQVIPEVAPLGWQNVSSVGTDHPYDVLLKKGDQEVRIQVKLQRSLRNLPWFYYRKHYSDEYYVVEVQKTRGGTKAGRPTRFYRFGDFDLLAVNMHPSSHDWNSFRYTLGAWLLPGDPDSDIEIMQPVAAIPNSSWTDNFATCLKWFEEAKQHRVLPELLHRKKRRAKKAKPT